MDSAVNVKEDCPLGCQSPVADGERAGMSIRAELLSLTALSLGVLVLASVFFARTSRCDPHPATADVDDTSMACPNDTIIATHNFPQRPDDVGKDLTDQRGGGTPTGAPLPADAVAFLNPMAKGVPIDHCLRWGKQCNQEAADSFCERNGFKRSVAFSLGDPIAKTAVVGDDVFCDFQPPHDPICQPFQSITCAH